MGLKTWIAKWMGAGAKESQEIPMSEFFEIAGDVYVRELAFWSCVNIVANAVSKCEFKTFVHGAETKGGEYYLWNIEPNQNQNSSSFMHKLIAQLYRNNEALVVEQNGQLLVADGFTRKPYALYEDIFEGVQICDYTLNRKYVQSEVLYFRLHERDMRQVTAGLYESYRSLIDYGMKSYSRSRGSRGILNISTMATQGNNFDEQFKKLMNEYFATFFKSSNAVLPLFEGFDYEDLGSKTYSNENTRDIRAMIDDVSDFTARAFGIPPVLLSGNVQGTKDAIDQLLTFCIDPLVDMLEEEINRKRSGRTEFLKGTYVEIDTKSIKHIDLLSVSVAIDKLISSGAFCINDIRELVGEAPIEEEWANRHFITKNYATVEEFLAQLSAEKEGEETG